MNPGFTVRFWGVRGTVPCPGADTLAFGGNTACVEVRCGDTLLIFDAGTGLRPLGRAILAADRAVKGHLFLSHTHLDHVLGLPFFKPAYSAAHRLELWNGHLLRRKKTLKGVIGRLMEEPYFPVPANFMQSCVAFHDFEAGDTLELGAVRLRTAELQHPGGATGYRLEHAGRVFCYVTDTSHEAGRLDPNVLELIQGADMVVYDSAYTEEELPRYEGWGHSTWEQGVRLCDAAGAKRLVAFHHDPTHDDAFMEGIERELGLARPGSFVAREGLAVELA